MHDIKSIQKHPDKFEAAMKKRGIDVSSRELIRLDDTRRGLIDRLQGVLTLRNAASKAMGKAIARNDPDSIKSSKKHALEIKSKIAELEAGVRKSEEDLKKVLETLPNIPLDDVPVGKDEEANVMLRKYGRRGSSFDFRPKQHFELGESLGMMNFDHAAKLSGARFTILSRDLARLERALGQFMIEMHTKKHGYLEVAPPLLVNDSTFYGTGQLPKFAGDSFRTEDKRWLIPTAEVPLTNLAATEILHERMLESAPARLVALTPCFRSEAGAAGRDTRGMLRQHQFMKAELVSIARPEDSLNELERMLGCAEAVLKELSLRYRVVTLSTGDMGFSACKTYDIEVWLPGQNVYREISSCSLCGDFQARRMNARYRTNKGTLDFVHTLNGSGVAVGRALIAILEQYQQADGSIKIPKALRRWFSKQDKIIPAESAVKGFTYLDIERARSENAVGES